MKKSLKSSKQHIVLVIATDGIPSDENGRVGEEQTELFVYALNRLKGLPLLLIIRLSTDDMTVRHLRFFFSNTLVDLPICIFITARYSHSPLVYSFTMR
jgi:hypothetical protein